MSSSYVPWKPPTTRTLRGARLGPYDRQVVDGDFDNAELHTDTLFRFASPLEGEEILVVDPSLEQCKLFENEFGATIANSIAEATRLCKTATPRAILCCKPTSEAFAFLATSSAEFRAVFGDYGELPALAKLRAPGVKVLAKTIAPHKLEKILAKRNRRETPGALLERTFSQLSDKMRVFVRKADCRGIELVLAPHNEADWSFDIAGWESSGQDLFGIGKGNRLGEFFVGNWQGTTAHLAWLPWSKKQRITVIVRTGDGSEPMTMEEADSIHGVAVQSVRHMVVPQVPEQMVYFSEYDWVLGPNYVGPDRRAEDTPMLGLHAVTGKRKLIPQNWPRPLAFADGLNRKSRRYLWLYLLLSTIDLVLTLVFIGAGVFREANGMLAWAIHRPVVFAVVKTGFAFGGFWLISRFQVWRNGLVARLAVFVYIFLLSYWAVLLANRFL